MDANQSCWLLLEKSDETRISKGIDGYQDKTGETYHYDSFVPNYKNLKNGDLVVLRKENEIIGLGCIGSITVTDDEKIHRRCPQCNSTDTRERKTKSPKWKCGHCAQEFKTPHETITEVRSYTAQIDGFSRLNAPPAVKDVKLCAANGDGITSQLSILQLDGGKVRTLLEATDVTLSPRSPHQGGGGQGFGLSQDERKAVELRAMQLGRKLYEDKDWTVVDTSNSNPFDLLATKGQEKRFIEVKGTTGEGHSVILTIGEVLHAKSHKEESALVIVSNIQLKKIDGKWTASSGKISTHEDPWIIKGSHLQATQFKYKVV